MLICRFVPPEGEFCPLCGWCVGLLMDGESLINLSQQCWVSVHDLLRREDMLEIIARCIREARKRLPLADCRLLTPIERHEVWAAGVTYLRSKAARMEESQFGATAYDRVYAAERPELFFKAQPYKVVGPGEPVGIRRDSRWTVPEPELVLVYNERGQLMGYTIGNDLSARDLEGENLLYLPQAKTYDRSCAIGPYIRLATDEATARTWQIELTIRRGARVVFTGATEVNRIKRSFTELGQFLFRSQTFPHAVVLLTGTGVVPPDDFSLQAGDVVEIAISGIGKLVNPVVLV